MAAAMPIELPRDCEVTSGRRISSDDMRAVASVVSGSRCSAVASNVISAKRAPGYSSTIDWTSARTPSRRGRSPSQSSATMLAVVSSTMTMSVSVARVSDVPPGMPGRSSIRKQARSMTRRSAHQPAPAPVEGAADDVEPAPATDARAPRTSIHTASAHAGANSSTSRNTLSTGWKITV